MKNVEASSDAANKVVDLLTKSADQIGHTAVTAFPYLVKYEWSQAVVGFGVGIVLLFASGIAVSKWNAWRKTGFDREEEGLGVACAGIAIVTAFAGLMFSGLNLPTILEPTGATIENLLRLTLYMK